MCHRYTFTAFCASQDTFPTLSIMMDHRSIKKFEWSLTLEKGSDVSTEHGLERKPWDCEWGCPSRNLDSVQAYLIVWPLFPFYYSFWVCPCDLHPHLLHYRPVLIRGHEDRLFEVQHHSFTKSSERLLIMPQFPPFSAHSFNIFLQF